MDKRVEHELIRLKGLNEVYRSLAAAPGSRFSLPQFLQLVVETGVRLTGAQYGALGIFDETGKGLSQFITAGIDEATRQRIGALPSGLGLLGYLAHQEGAVRLKDIAQHMNSVGFPPNHPPMKSFLGISIRAHGRLFGRLYLTEKQDTDEFSEVDEEVIRVLATQAGAAIENGTLSEEIRAARSKYLTLLESTGEGICGLDLLGRVTFVNQMAVKLLGYTADELNDQPMHSIFHHSKPDGSPCPASKCLILATLRDGHVHHMASEVFCRKDGTSFPVEYVSTPLQEAGELAGAVIVFHDISERKRVKAALEESREQFRQLAEHIQEVFWLTDPAKNQIIYVSPAYEETWKRSCESLYASPRSWFEAIHPDDHDRVLHAALNRQTSGKYDEEYRIVRPDGSIRWIRDRAFPIRDSSGLVYRIAGLAEDITGYRQLEAQFRQSQKMEAVGQLSGGIAHDFNNLLSVINSYSDMLLEESSFDDPSLRKLIEPIREAGQRAAGLTRQLLAFSRRQMLEPKVLDLNEVVSNIANMLRRLIGEDISLVICPDPTLGRVKADPGQIEQVIMNLTVNARDAMPRGGQLTIETMNVELDNAFASTHASVTPGRYVMLAVTDTGCGMDTETQTHIFEPFFTTKGFGKGTGLGLATVYGIVKQSGGSIWVYSEQGKGCSFKIYLPQVEDKAEPMGPAPVPLQDQRGAETILLVEDEEMVRALTQAILGRYGYTVLVARTPHDALCLAQKGSGSIHLLLTDIVMPEMSGPELAERFVSVRPESKVLYMSGYTDKALPAMLQIKPNFAFLQKPFTPAVLARKVREVLNSIQQR